jgi:hypothetical protein
VELQTLREILGWSVVVNFGLLLLWLAMFTWARGFLKGLHGRWFTLEDANFDAIHYGLMGAFKIGIWLLLLAPWLAIHIVT